jgi:hypothetical protein
MNEKVFLRPLAVLMAAGLLCLILAPPAHIGRGGFLLGRILTVGILIVLGYLGLRKRFELRILSKPGLVRRFFWACLSVPLILIAAFVGADISNRKLPPVKDAIQIARESEVTKSRLGEPIRIGWPVESSRQISGSSGHVLLRIPIAGPNGQGTVRVIGAELNGVWKVDQMTLIMRDTNAQEDLLSVGSH